ncbi:MAG TPA: hypothetical protein VIJ14_03315, partial [Rhabdochlamydiaceae bacterium]
MTIFAEASPDYYLKRYSPVEYSHLLQTLTKARPDPYLCVTERGLLLIPVIQYVWEKFKAYFGFENRAQVEKVQAEWLKFLHYGLIEEYFLNPENLESLRSLEGKTSDSVKRTIEIILDNQDNKLKRVQDELTHYGRIHAEALKPALWNRCFFARTVYSYPRAFGETYLSLAEQPQLYTEERVEYLYHAASPKFSLEDSYCRRLESCFNALKTFDLVQSGHIHLQMSRRKQLQNDHHSALSHLIEAKQAHGRLSSYHRYLEFISSAHRLSPQYAATFDGMTGWKSTCFEACKAFLKNPPEFPDGEQKLRPDYASALVTLGDYHLSSSTSVGTRMMSWVGSTAQKSSLESALECYTKALVFTDGAKEREVMQKLWDHIDKMRELGVNLEKFGRSMAELALRSPEPVAAAQQSLVCLKCFPNTALFSQWEEIAERFAHCIAQVYQSKAFAKHFVLLDFSLQHVKTCGEETKSKFVEILCRHLSIDDLRNSGEDIWRFQNSAYNLGLRYREQKKWEKAARQFLIYLQCSPPNGSNEWKECCESFAECLATSIRSSETSQYPDLLNQAILYHRDYELYFFRFLNVLCEQFRSLPTEAIPMSLSVRAVFVNALMNLGHAHLEQAQSSISKGLRIATVGVVNYQKEGALKALDYYILASDFASGPQRKQIASVLCKNLRLDEIRKAGINLENFRQGAAELAFEYFQQQDWEHAAHQFLLCLKCFSPEELAKSPEGAKITVF